MIAALVVAGCALCAALMAGGPRAEAAGKLPRVLLIGDSISGGYKTYVAEAMKDVAEVSHSGNASSTRNGLKILPGLLKTKYDVIHFNWGLHDVKIIGQSVPVEEYERNLRELVKQLKASGARLVWASTTPVGPGVGDIDAEVVSYNAVAKKVMDENKIPIDDLYALAKPQLDKIQKNDRIHFEDEGYKILAKSVVESILAAGKASK